MIHSMRARLTVIVSIIMLVTLTLSLGINTVFLDKYYQTTKTKALISVYDKLASISGEDEEIASENNISVLNSYCETNGATILVEKASGEYVYTYGAVNMLQNRMASIIFDRNEMEDVTSVSVTDDYILQIVNDKVSSQEYMEMYGNLDNGNYFIMRVAFDSINESVEISNRFFTYISLILLLLSTVIIIFISGGYTKPILELAALSKKMSELDFNAKYVGKRNDEIGVLGNSMNELSSKLEKNISELKKANLELQKDIDRKTEIDEQRKEFISNVSHELKTPIALIQGYAEGLKEAVNDDPESRDFYCDVIMDEAVKMNKMVRNLLELNQIEYGGRQVNVERFDIISVISGILRSAQIMIEQNGITVEFDANHSIDVWADEFQIEEVVTNYISNAINHCAYDKIIRINIEEKDGNVRVSVFNTGDHIPENEIDNIWIKFYKVDKARTREYGGNGIGLSIVRAIMESHNKQCGVNNVEGGVEFWFELDGKNETEEDN